MSDRIESSSVWRLEVPAGRLIGDNTCSYDRFIVTVVALSTSSLQGWGFGVTAHDGTFSKPAYWIRRAASLAELQSQFSAVWEDALMGSTIEELGELGEESALWYLDAAVRMSIWDLRAKAVGVPLYQTLADRLDSTPRRFIRAYGSLLDYPLNEAEAIALASSFASRGFFAVKVKVGAPAAERDLRRLQAVRRAVGPSVQITADANEAWDAVTALDRLAAFREQSIELGYIEDALPSADIAGFQRLRAEGLTPIAAHDYVNTSEQIEELLRAGAVNFLRVAGEDVDLFLSTARLARHFGVPMIVGNSFGEVGAHFALALPEVDRIEFSDLAWNDMLVEPIVFAGGGASAPTRPGHGLEPRPEALVDLCRP
jgi:L-alanine-DL-glutamate epimerase-like enolase superfamily enzyme